MSPGAAPRLEQTLPLDIQHSPHSSLHAERTESHGGLGGCTHTVASIATQSPRSQTPRRAQLQHGIRVAGLRAGSSARHGARRWERRLGGASADEQGKQPRLDRGSPSRLRTPVKPQAAVLWLYRNVLVGDSHSSGWYAYAAAVASNASANRKPSFRRGRESECVHVLLQCAQWSLILR